MHVLERIISLIAPHRCLACGEEGSPLCPPCLQSVIPAQPRCHKCGKQSAECGICMMCTAGSSLDGIYVSTSYMNAAKALVGKLKFERSPAAAAVIAKIMDSHLPDFMQTSVVTHAPTATSRIRQRGYDQAALIAKQFAALRNLPYRPLLIRVGHQRQLGQHRLQRQRQLQGAFRLQYPLLPTGTILLVDDVITTGSTLEYAAAELLAGGAYRVTAVVFSSAPSEVSLDKP